MCPRLTEQGKKTYKTFISKCSLHSRMVSVQESRNISVSNNMQLAFFNGKGTSYIMINQNFPMNTLNLTIFVISNISVIIVNILVLIWLKVSFSNFLFSYDSAGAQEMLIFVRLFVRFKGAFNHQYPGSDLHSRLSADSQQSLSSSSTVFQQSLSSLSTVSQQSLSSFSALS